jgi:DNA invertase Pin-like site-specific DNA recombinase
MIYGYARVSSKGQETNGNSLEDQQDKLKAAGCQKVIVEQFTGTTTDRPLFAKLIHNLVQGDTLKVTKLDRLARTASKGSELVKSLLDKGVTVHILNMGLLDNTPTGRLIMNVLLSFAEFERDMIIERTQSGKVIARTKAGYKEGRPPISQKKLDVALELIHSGHTYKEVVESTGISKSTLIRAMRRNHLNKKM